MRYQKWSNGVKIYCYSQQKSRKNLVHDPNCDNPRIDASELEKFVIDDLLKFSIEYSKKNSPHAKASVRDVLKARQKTVETKIKNLYNLYSQSPDDILLNTIEENKKELDDIIRKIENEKDRTVSKEELLQREKTIRSVNEGWNEMTDSEKRSVIRACIKKVTVCGERVDIQYNF